jgi:hypothetical protein
MLYIALKVVMIATILNYVKNWQCMYYYCRAKNSLAYWEIQFTHVPAQVRPDSNPLYEEDFTANSGFSQEGVQKTSNSNFVIKLKYCSNLRKLDLKEDMALADVAMEKVPKEAVDASLAAAARKKLKRTEIDKILGANLEERLSEAETNHLLTKAALTSLSKEEIDEALVKMVRERLSPEEIAEIFLNAAT